MIAELGFIKDFMTREGENDVLKSNWYTIAATAFAAAGAGKDVPALYRLACNGHDLITQKLIQRRFKEAILKTSILYGIPRSLQALLPLFATLKDDEIDHYGPRTEAMEKGDSKQARKKRAKEYFNTIWTPEAAEANRQHNFKFHPDLYLLNMELVYERWISEDAILSNVETQMCNIAALICSVSPVQAMWHTRGLIRHGGSIGQAEFAMQLALAVAERYGIKTDGVVLPADIDFDDRTPH